MVSAFRQQPIDKRVVDAVWRKDCFGNALRGVLVEIESGGTEGQVEVGDDGIEHQIARDREPDIVGYGRGPYPAFGADHGDDAADRFGVRRGKQPAHCAHDLQRVDRRDQIIADAAAHQLTVQRNVVRPADDDHPRRRIANRRELIKTVQNVVTAAFRFQNNDIRCRRALVRFDGGGQTAHLNAQVRLGQAPVFAGCLDGGGGLYGFAKRLHRNTRCRRDIFLAAGEFGSGVIKLNGLAGWAHARPLLSVIIDRGR